MAILARIIVLIAGISLTACHLYSGTMTSVTNVGSGEIFVDEFMYDNYRLPVGYLDPGHTASHFTYDSSIPEEVFFKWRVLNDENEEFEYTIKIPRPLPKRTIGEGYKILFQIDNKVKASVTVIENQTNKLRAR